MSKDGHKVFDLLSRKPLEQAEADRREAEKRVQEEAASLAATEKAILEQEAVETREQYSSLVGDIERLVKNQNVDGVIVVAKHRESGFFYHDIAFGPSGCSPNEAFGWIGILETLKAELLDIALTAPTIAPDGEIIQMQFMCDDAPDDDEDYE